MGDENVMTVLLNEEGETTGDRNRGVDVVISDELCSRNHGVNEWVLNDERWDQVSPHKGSITISRSFTLRGIPVVI